MNEVLGTALILSGLLLMLSGPRLARDRRAVWAAVATNEAIAAFWLYLGVRFLGA